LPENNRSESFRNKDLYAHLPFFVPRPMAERRSLRRLTTSCGLQLSRQHGWDGRIHDRSSDRKDRVKDLLRLPELAGTALRGGQGVWMFSSSRRTFLPQVGFTAEKPLPAFNQLSHVVRVIFTRRHFESGTSRAMVGLQGSPKDHFTGWRPLSQ
jgi:hypothetical protein